MIFQNPAGLWTLMGIPLLVFLYCKKPRYEECTVSSVYLWKLSERFRKRHMPMQRLKKLLLFMLQLLLIVTASLLMAQPRLTFLGTGIECVVILDTSGSMRIADGAGETRFARAQEETLALLDHLRQGSVVTVLSTAEEKALVYRTPSFSEARRAVERIQCSYGAPLPDKALEEARKIAAIHPGTQVFLYTDKEYPAAGGITVTDVSGHQEWNAALTGLTSKRHPEGTAFFTDIVSYGKDASVIAALYVDRKLTAARIIDCKDGETTTVEWDVQGVGDYYQAHAVLNVADALAEDNSFSCFQPSPESVRILLVSEKPFYLSNILNAFPAVNVITISEPGLMENAGFDLYVYSGCMPDEMPSDGAVWFFDPPSAPVGTDIVLGEELLGGPLSAAANFADPALSRLTENMTGGASVLKFREITSAGSYAVILRCGRLSAAVAGEGVNGAKLLLAAFDLTDSNLPLLTDFVYFIGNALQFSMPAMLDGQLFTAGDTLSVTALPFAREVTLMEPGGGMRSLTVQDGAAPAFLRAPGAYTVLQQRGELSAKVFDFYAAFPVQEGDPTLAFDMSDLTADITRPENTPDPEEEIGRLFDPGVYLAAFLLLFLILECVVYQREQF